MTSYPKVMGIVNLTPDSFSDGGQFSSSQAAIDYAAKLIDEGADILDVGAESTRPGATPLNHEEEWKRLSVILPQIIALGAPVSVDTRHPETVKHVIGAGVEYINDVSGFENPEMLEAVLPHKHVKIIAMHHMGIPVDPATIMNEPPSIPVQIAAWITKTLARLIRLGITRERIILDPGIGFGKNAAQSIHLIKEAHRLTDLGIPILFGHSRKSFLKNYGDATAENRDLETVVVSLRLAQQNVQFIRVHNVKAHRNAFRIADDLDTP